MGTTLQNGVYLPNEGERNCYAGLKTNWEILDQKVADVTALQQAVAGALHREIVENLPTTDIDPNTIYMILSGTSATENVYNEFMYVNNAWELIGTSATDLTNYYTKGDVDGLLLLKANASDLTSHTGDTTIHVTASDKSKWDTVALIKQLRLVNTQVGSATTIAFANIDDTNGIKVGDKCMDLDAKMFEITAVDTTNQTVTVGSALIDLALDSDVVHLSGSESIIGSKRFGVVQNFTGYPTIRLYSTSDDITVVPPYVQQQDIRFTDKNNNIIAYFIFQHRSDANEPFRTCWRQVRLDGTDGYYSVNFNNLGEFYPENNNGIKLGKPNNRWSGVYSTNYYYGSNNVEFSQKFVTTDTNQTISGDKVWTGTNTFKQNITYERTNFYHQSASPCYMLKDTELEKGSLASTHTAYPGLWQDKNNNVLGYVRFVEYNSGRQTAEFRVSNLIKNGALDPTGTEVNCTVNLELQPSGEKSLIPERNNDINLGTSTNKWKTLNGVEPSSLSLPGYSGSKIDISSYIADLTGGSNNYTVPSNGYIFVRTNNGTYLKLTEYPSGVCSSVCSQTADDIGTFLPVNANRICIIAIKCSSIDRAYFIPCQGNV